MEENFIADSEGIDEQLLNRGTMVYSLTDPAFCGIITAILIDVNDCITYRVNDKFYYASELTAEPDKPNPIKGLK